MPLSNVEQAVLQKSGDEVRKIQEQARADADAFLEKESARIRQEHERRVADARRDLEAALERETGAKETADRHKLLKIKNEIIDEIFQKAVAGLLTLPDDGYAKWVRAQVDKLPEMQRAVLVANGRDRELLAEALSEAGRASLKVAEKPAAIAGGFLVRGELSDLDCSIEALMEALRESLTEEVAARLFGEGAA